MKKYFKIIYGAFPFKQQLFSILRMWFVWPDSITKHLYFNGIIDFKVEDKIIRMHQKGYDVENTLFWRGVSGCWEANSVKIWIELVKLFPGTILDIGANTGAYALIAKTVSPSSQVHAFEPIPLIYDKLVSNIELNKLSIRASSFAISNYNGEATVYAEDFSHLYSVTVNKNLIAPQTKTDSMTIKTTTLESYFYENNLTSISLLKWDIETHEPEGIEGMGILLKKFKPPMIVEILNEDVAHKIEQQLDGLGYLYFNIHEFKGIRRTDHIEKSDYYNYLFCDNETAQKLNLV